MRSVSNLMKNTYSGVNVNSRVNPYAACGGSVNSNNGAKSSANKKNSISVSSVYRKDNGSMAADVREIRRMLSNSNQAQNSNAKIGAQSSVVSSMFSYSESLKAQRQQAKDTNLKLKKLKYQFKDMSSKILRSKTSASARQVASQAKREVLRLKREKQSGLYDDEEIEAAITHAKAMERVAKKKVRHLEEEEMAKAAGGPCAGEMVEEEKEKTADTDEQVEEEYADEEELAGEYASEGAYDNEAYSRELSIFSRQDFDEMMDLQLEMSEDMSELTDELWDEFAEEMQAMLEDMGMDELSEGLSVARGDMDPADLKMMKIKHRNKEMKDIVKADSEYLKAVFDHLAKLKAGGSIPGMGSIGGTSAGGVPSGIGTSMPLPALGGAAAVPEPMIDISL